MVAFKVTRGNVRISFLRLLSKINKILLGVILRDKGRDLKHLVKVKVPTPKCSSCNLLSLVRRTLF